MVNISQHPQICAMLSALLFVDYQWCHVLFKNNTVSAMMTAIMALRVMLLMVEILFVILCSGESGLHQS